MLKHYVAALLSLGQGHPQLRGHMRIMVQPAPEGTLPCRSTVAAALPASRHPKMPAHWEPRRALAGQTPGGAGSILTSTRDPTA